MIYKRLCPLDHVARADTNQKYRIRGYTNTLPYLEDTLSDAYSCNFVPSLIFALFLSASPKPCNDLKCFSRCHPSIRMPSLGSRLEKTCLQSLRQGDTQASLQSYRVII